MGRPLNKKFFGADADNNLKVQFHNGTASVKGYVVEQLGTKKFKCRDKDGVTAICRVVMKDSADLQPGEMSITVKYDDNTVRHVYKISAHRISVNPATNNNTTAGMETAGWTFGTSTSDGLWQIEEAGTNAAMAGSTDLEGDDVVLIPANTLTANNGIQAFYDPTLYFWDQTKANQFKAASPSTFYYVEYDGTQTKAVGATFGNVVAGGMYWGIQVLTGTRTVGTYLSGAANSRIYY